MTGDRAREQRPAPSIPLWVAQCLVNTLCPVCRQELLRLGPGSGDHGPGLFCPHGHRVYDVVENPPTGNVVPLHREAADA